MALPCPNCRTPLGLDLTFIFENPVCVCPGCKAVLDFTINDEIKQTYREAMAKIDEIKSQYKDIAKFGSK